MIHLIRITYLDNFRHGCTNRSGKLHCPPEGLVNFDQSFFPNNLILKMEDCCPRERISTPVGEMNGRCPPESTLTSAYSFSKPSPRSSEQSWDNLMSEIETVPSTGILEFVKRHPVVSHQVSAAPIRPRSGAGLPSRIAVVGNYLPRQCGIATFTTDLCEAISTEYGSPRLFAVPVNDTESGYPYPARVRLALAQDDLSSYEQAAEFLNFTNFDLVSLQHEYGIFGGPAGSHILALLRRLKMPVITTLHTVLREPSLDQRLVMEEIAAVSDRLIVMSELSAQFLQEIFKVPGDKIDFIRSEERR